MGLVFLTGLTIKHFTHALLTSGNELIGAGTGKLRMAQFSATPTIIVCAAATMIAFFVGRASCFCRRSVFVHATAAGKSPSSDDYTFPCSRHGREAGIHPM